MKLLSQPSEIRCLRTICDGPPKIAGRLLNAMTEDSFHFPPCKEAYKRVRSLLRTHGESPSWSELCADPVLSESTRVVMKASPEKPLAAGQADKVTHLVKVLDRFRQARILSTMVEDLSSQLEDDSLDVEAVLDDIGSRLLKARTKTDSETQMYHIGRGNNSSQLVKDMLNGIVDPVVPTGFKAFDSINRGFLRGASVVIASNTGGGKSSLAINLCNNMANAGYDVCIVPLEMSESQMMARLSALRTGMSVGKVSQRQLATGEKKKVVSDYKDIVESLKEKDARLTIFVPDEDLSMEDLLLYLKPFKYDVVIIDYIGLLKGADDDDQARKLGAMGRFAKIWANNTNSVVINLAQLDDKTKNIRYSRALKEHANSAWFWYMPEAEEEISILDIRQVKARNQKRFSFQLQSINSSGLITDLDEGQKTDNDSDSDSDDDGESVSSKRKKAASAYLDDIASEDEESDDED